jgi:hypothetical protein
MPFCPCSFASTADSVAEEFATLQSSLLAICSAGSRLLVQPRLSSLPTSKRSSMAGMGSSNSGLAAGRASAIMHGALLRRNSNDKSTSGSSGSGSEGGAAPVLRASGSVTFRNVDSEGNPVDSEIVAYGVDGAGLEMEMMMDPPAPMIDQLEVVLSSAHDWQFDAFALAEASCGHPLSALAFYLFHR